MRRHFVVSSQRFPRDTGHHPNVFLGIPNTIHFFLGTGHFGVRDRMGTGHFGVRDGTGTGQFGVRDRMGTGLAYGTGHFGVRDRSLWRTGLVI